MAQTAVTTGQREWFLGKKSGHNLILVQGPSWRDASQNNGMPAGTGAGWPEVLLVGKPPPSTGSGALKARCTPHPLPAISSSQLP